MTDRKKSLTDMQEAFLEALFSEECYGDYEKAMKKAGYKDPKKYMMVVAAIKDEIMERAQTYMALHAPFAAMETVGLVKDPTQVASKEKLSALKEVLDRGGLVKIDKHELKGDGSAGAVFLLPAKDSPYYGE